MKDIDLRSQKFFSPAADLIYKLRNQVPEVYKSGHLVVWDSLEEFEKMYKSFRGAFSYL